METTVNVEMVEGTSYTTLKQSFSRGEVYELPHSEWQKLSGELHPTTGKPYFALCKKEATSVPASTERQDVIKGGGITIAHNVTPPMSPAEMDKAGFGAFARHARRDSHPKDNVDTGAGVVVEDENYSGPSGHDGLDDEDPVQISASSESAQDAPQTVEAANPAPTSAAAPKKAVVVSKGKAVVPKKSADDEVKV